MEHLIAAPPASPSKPQLRQAADPKSPAAKAVTAAGRSGSFRALPTGETAPGSAQPAEIAGDTAGGETAGAAGSVGGGEDGCADVGEVESECWGGKGDTGGAREGLRTAEPSGSATSTAKGANVRRAMSAGNGAFPDGQPARSGAYFVAVFSVGCLQLSRFG